MQEIYYEVVGDIRYSVFESQIDERKSYSISIDNNIINDFTSIKNRAIQFTELLIVNAVSPLHIYCVAQNYI